MSTLSAQNLRKQYKGRQVVKDISVAIQSGEVVGLLGPNGAGKTTCFYMIVGLIPLDRGSIAIDGTDVSNLPMHQRARLGIGYLPQEPSVFRKLSVEDNILAILETIPEMSDETATSVWKSCCKNCISPNADTPWGSVCPAANADAWKLRAHWPRARVSSCWMSRSPALIPFRFWISSSSSPICRNLA